MQPLASSRGTSNGPDWKDVTQALVGYEHFWQSKIILSIQLSGESGVKVLMLEGKVTPREEGESARFKSVYLSVLMRGLNATTLSAAFLNLLHRLDREVELSHTLQSDP